MNILVFSWRGPKHPNSGGAEQVMHEHMKGWVVAGHEVTLFTSSFYGGNNEEFIDGIKIIRHGSQYLTVHLFAFAWYLFGKHGKYDLVVDQFHGWPFFTPLYVRCPKLAVIQELTREVWFKYPLPLGLNYLLGTIGFLAEPLFFLFYRNTHFMTGSESAKKELQIVGIKNENITVVPHGVILDLPKKLPEKEKKPTIVFLGALAADKGIEDALTVFSLLKKTRKYQFWILGKGDVNYVKYLKQKTRQLDIDKETVFFGFVTQAKKFDLLARSHIMINPSIREGWGLVNIEANAVGTPVIAYPSPGLVDSVKNNVNGIICADKTPKSMVSQVESLMADSKKLEVLSKMAVAWSNNFTWEKSKQKSLEVVEDLACR